jgi:hypothetical protein
MSINFSRRETLGAAIGLGAAAFMPPTLAMATVPAGAFAFPVGTVDPLHGVKKVAIISYVVQFRTETKTEKKQGILAGRTITEAINRLSGLEAASMQAVADRGLADLKAKFIARGIEVVEQSVLDANPAYQKLHDMMELRQGDQLTGFRGKSVVYGPTTLLPSLPFADEMSELISLNSFRVITHQMPNSKPAFEIDLAASLGAVLVKAWYAVSFAKLDPNSRLTAGTFGNLFASQATADSQVGGVIDANHSRLSFRLPNGNRRGMGQAVFFQNRDIPARDGDIVVACAQPAYVGRDYLAQQANNRRGFNNGYFASVQFQTQVVDQAKFTSETADAIANVQSNMLEASFG